MTQNLEPEKLDCPFCGKQPKTGSQYAWGGAIVGGVMCVTTDCVQPAVTVFLPPPHQSDAASALKAINMAIDKWNKRP